MKEKSEVREDRRGVFFALIFSVLTASGMLFANAFLLPKAKEMYFFNTPAAVPSDQISFALWLSDYLNGALTIAILLFGMVFLALCVPRNYRIQVKWIAWPTYLTSITLLGMFLWLYTTTMSLMLDAMLSQRMKLRTMGYVLQEFEIEDAANDEYERIVAIYRQRSLPPPVLVTKESDLDRSERNLRLGILTKQLESTPDNEVRKRILATLPMLKTTIQKEQKLADRLMKRSSEIAGKNFEDTDQMLEWIQAQADREGWKPVPLYQFKN